MPPLIPPSPPQVTLRRQQRWDNCTFPAAASFRGPSLHVALSRVLRAGLARTSVGRAAVTFPPSLRRAGPPEGGGAATVDVTARALRRAGPLVTEAVAVALSDPATGAAVPLRDAVRITFPLPRPLPRQPPEDWYRCARAAGGAWATDGVRLTADAEDVHCDVTVLSTVAVLPVVRVLQVQVLLWGLRAAV